MNAARPPHLQKCSYNAVNGVPTCASDTLTSVLRGAWNFSGYITSDSGAIEDVYLPFPKGHHYVDTPAEAACVSIRNGTTDVCSGAVYHDALMDSVSSGLCSRADVDAALAVISDCVERIRTVAVPR